MRSLVWALVAAVLITAIACGPGEGMGGGGGGGTGGAGGGTGGGSAGGGAGGGSAGGGSGGGAAGGGSGGGAAGGGSGGGGGGNPRLLGITWNGNLQMDAGQYELRRLDPQTGVSNLVAALPNVQFFGGAQIADPARGRLYFVTYALDAGPRLYTVDATNGSVLGNPFIDRPDAGDYNWSGGLHLRQDGGLVGVTWNGRSDAGSEELRTIDPATGLTAKVAAIPGMDWVLSGANASDPARDVVYAIAIGGADTTYRLFSFRLSDGVVVANPYVDAGTTGLTPQILMPRSNGSLRTIAAAWAGDAGVVHVSDLNPTTGLLSSVATLPVDGFVSSAHAFHAFGDRVYFFDGQPRLFTVNAGSGAVVSNPQVAPNGSGLPYYFGGGLFFFP